MRNSAKIKILLVDDDPDFLEFIGMRIEAWGYNLIKATTGVEAVDTVKNRLSDLVILDYRLPEMDGITALQKIREIDDKIQVIILTAHPSVDALKWSDKLKVSAFIPKLSAHSNLASSLRLAIEKAEQRLLK